MKPERLQPCVVHYQTEPELDRESLVQQHHLKPGEVVYILWTTQEDKASFYQLTQEGFQKLDQ